MCDNFGQGEVRSIHVKVAFDDLQVWGYLTKEIVGLFVGKIPKTEDLSNLARCQQLLKLEELAQHSSKKVWHSSLYLGWNVLFLPLAIEVLENVRS